jgi:hypothetical protein
MYSYVCMLFLLVKKGSMDDMDPVGLGGEGSPGRFRKSTSSLAGGAGNNGVEEDAPGFLLFECQINSLLNHSQGSTPLFLRCV